MTDTDIRQTLTAIHDAVAVPLVDRAAFEGRVRRARRQRRGLQVLAGGTALAAAVTGVAVVTTTLDRAEPQGFASVPDRGVPVVLDGHVQVLAGDGTLTDTGLSGTPLGTLDGQLVVLDGHRLLGLADGVIDDVATAYVDDEGVTYENTDGIIVFAGRRGQNSAQGPGTLLAGGSAVYVDDEGDGPVIHDARGLHPVDLSSDGADVDLDRVEVGDDTVVFVGEETVQVFDARGVRRDSFLGGTTGALSADGTTYAFAPDADELAQGMTPGLAFYDTSTGDQQRIPFTGAALDVAWSDGDLYVLTEQGSSRVLLQCGTAGCAERYTDPTGTLALR